MTALVPFECPQCTRDYRVELDFVKMRRLNRIAVCPSCNGRYSLSVRLEKSAAPFDPDPYAAERSATEEEPRRDSTVRRVRDARPNRPMADVAFDAPVLVFDSSPPIADAPPADSWPAQASSPPPERLARRDSRPAQHSAAPPASEPPPGRVPTAPIRRSPLARQSPLGRQDTEPDSRPPFVVDDAASDPAPRSDAPLSDRRPRRTSSARHERTLEGVGRGEGERPGKAGVGVHVIVEVGMVDKPNRRKTTKSYRPEHLVTLPGLGAPKKQQPSSKP